MSNCALCGNDHNECPGKWIAEAINDGAGSLRDRFAIAALTGIIAGEGASHEVAPAYASKRAYAMADAMLEQRDAK